jgi:hypothetical protein
VSLDQDSRGGAPVLEHDSGKPQLHTPHCIRPIMYHAQYEGNGRPAGALSVT